MSGRRIFERFGFNLPPDTDKPKSKEQILIDYDEWIFYSKVSDWFNIETGELLTNYSPTDELKFLLRKNVDIIVD